MKHIILLFYLRGESYFAFSTTNKLLEGLVQGRETRPSWTPVMPVAALDPP